ncbi:MAG TPA: hypothetical protein DF613_02535 [Lachnospiraceae bacterium]|nr:hypothetical protein [Lachnospiraceae bacterium]
MVSRPVQDLADLTDRKVLPEIIFKDPLDAFLRSKAIKGQGNDHFFKEMVIRNKDLGIRGKDFAKTIHTRGKGLPHAMEQPGNMVPQDINIISGYLELVSDF